MDKGASFVGEKLAKDRGWAWLVLLGASIEMALLVGIVKSSGILFVAFQDRFHSSSSMTSLLSTVQNICQSFMALAVMTFGVKVTNCRNLLFVGSIITCTAYIITSQAEDIRVLLFSHGVLQGLGAGFMQPTALNMIGIYFEKRRGLANSIAVSGGSIGGLILAPMITSLLSTYGYQGGVLILAGVMLNGCVSGALFRPLSFYDCNSCQNNNSENNNKYNKRYLSLDDTKGDNTDNDIQQEVPLVAPDLVFYDSASTSSVRMIQKDSCESLGKAQTYKSYSADDLVQKRRDNVKTINMLGVIIANSEKSRKTSLSAPILYSECRTDGYDLDAFGDEYSSKTFKQRSDLEMATCEDQVENKSFRKVQLIFQYLSEIFNLRLLRKPVFLAFLMQGCLICSGTVLAPIFIAPYARDIGLTRHDVATLVTLLSCIDLFSRILVGYISDRNWLRRSNIVAIATLVVSLSTNVLRYCTSYNTLLGYAIVMGLVSGVYFALWPVVVIDYLTLDNFQTCLGFMAVVHGFSVAGAFYLIGYLRDVSGSYILPHHVIGGATGIGAIILFFLPIIERL